jgi:hypothetical protein
MKSARFSVILVALAVLSVLAARAQAPLKKPETPKTMRLYVFDCGVINVNRAGTERYKVTPEEVGETRFSVPCFLIAHPKGTLMWDLGILPDDTVEARARGEQGNATATSAAVTTVSRTLRSQLADLGLPAGGHHLLRLLTRSRRPQRQRQSVHDVDMARASRRTGVHVGRRQHASEPHVLR